MKTARYEYVVIDSGWEGNHDERGIFHSDAKQLPDMKGLCDYVHSLGLKVGIHTSPGLVTCSGHEATYGHEQQDARTFADWRIDFVKYDWCSGDQVYKPEQMRAAYQIMPDALKATGRQCSTAFANMEYRMSENGAHPWAGRCGEPRAIYRAMISR